MRDEQHLTDTTIAFIGGGNMASAIIGGLLRQGGSPARLQVVDPYEPTRARLASELAITAQSEAGPALAGADVVVWAVKPQTFRDAAAPVREHASQALHLSVAAGIRSDSIATWLGTQRVVRAMPNTPALVGNGMTGLFGRAAVTAQDRTLVQGVLGSTGELMWMDNEEQLDAVTALSGSGPAYVFYFLEAMREAGVAMGLSAEQATRLAVGTFRGGAALAAASSDPPEVLRERVTSKGGTTYAALTAMEAAGIKPAFVRALHAAQARAVELGDEFGA